MRSALSRVSHHVPSLVVHHFMIRGVVALFPLLCGVLLVTLFATLAQPIVASPAAQQADLSPGSVGAGVFAPVGDSVGPLGIDIAMPSLAIQPQSVEPWMAVAQNNRIFISKYISATAIWA